MTITVATLHLSSISLEQSSAKALRIFRHLTVFSTASLCKESGSKPIQNTPVGMGPVSMSVQLTEQTLEIHTTGSQGWLCLFVNLPTVELGDPKEQ